jgi:hypothetical protein
MDKLHITHAHIDTIPDTAYIDWMGIVHVVEAHVDHGLLLVNTITGEHTARLYLEFAFVLNYDVQEVEDDSSFDAYSW